MAEFTGERVIPGQVDQDLLNEHLARYAFAARLARGKRVLDLGCGAGYGTAELARVAAWAAGIDISAEALEFARTHYVEENLSFARASCLALPWPDGCFDLVVAFEVIEHLAEWRAFLDEARRVVAPGGQFVVSTPNQLYYTESRGPEGANPFHAHEFEFAEFQRELARVLPHVSMFLENHVEGVTFQPCGAQPAADVRVDTGHIRPEDAHFFIAVCAHRPQVGGPTFVYVPRAANVLREREKHIALLAGELRAKDAWLEEARQSLAALNDEHQKLLEMFRAQTGELERSNLWAQQLDENLVATRLRIAGLQDELAAQQAAAREMDAGYQAKVAELEEDLRVKAEWAVETERRLTAELTARAEELDSKCAELARCVEILHAVEKDLEERTAWALRLEANARDLDARLAMFRASRWVKLGQTVGLGPEKSSV